MGKNPAKGKGSKGVIHVMLSGEATGKGGVSPPGVDYSREGHKRSRRRWTDGKSDMKLELRLPPPIPTGRAHSREREGERANAFIKAHSNTNKIEVWRGEPEYPTTRKTARKGDAGTGRSRESISRLNWRTY